MIFCALWMVGPLMVEKNKQHYDSIFSGEEDSGIIERYRSFFERTKYCVYIHDFQGNFLDANQAALDLLGFSREDIPRMKFSDILEEDQMPVAFKAMEEILTDGFMSEINDLRLRKKDGAYVWVETESSIISGPDGPVAIQGVARDITRRKNAEEALLRSEQFNRSLVEAAPVGILYLDADGVITYENKSMMRMMGVPEGTRSPILGLRISDIPPIADAGIVPMIRRVLNGETISGAEVSYLSLMGKDLELEVHAAPLMGDQGVFEGAIVMALDITERKRTEDALMRAQKLDSLGVLAGGIAHDFNNVLTGILGNISMARLAASDDGELADKLTQAENACFHARDLTRQLLTFSRGGTPIKKIINPGNTLSEAANFALSGSKNRPEIRIEDSLMAVDADEGQLRQVMSNIIINADQAMPMGGVIRIRAGNLDQKERMVAADGTVIEPGKYVELVISDEGIGIPADYLGRIFDPYFTTKRKGSGLGLAVSYSIVRNHQGHIRVESNPGGGTVFTVYLPAVEDKVLPDSPERKTGSGESGGRVLVMDDDMSVGSVALGLLEMLGFEAVVVVNSKGAVDEYRSAFEAGNPFDAVILDLTIPGGTGGKDTAEQIRTIDPGACLIVSSGYSNDPVMSRYAEYGFMEVLPKPYRIEDLSRVLTLVTENKKR